MLSTVPGSTAIIVLRCSYLNRRHAPPEGPQFCRAPDGYITSELRHAGVSRLRSLSPEFYFFFPCAATASMAALTFSGSPR
jgi:hypothetical protein